MCVQISLGPSGIFYFTSMPAPRAIVITTDNLIGLTPPSQRLQRVGFNLTDMYTGKNTRVNTGRYGHTRARPMNHHVNHTIEEFRSCAVIMATWVLYGSLYSTAALDFTREIFLGSSSGSGGGSPVTSHVRRTQGTASTRRARHATDTAPYLAIATPTVGSSNSSPASFADRYSGSELSSSP